MYTIEERLVEIIRNDAKKEIKKYGPLYIRCRWTAELDCGLFVKFNRKIFEGCWYRTILDIFLIDPDMLKVYDEDGFSCKDNYIGYITL